MSSSITRKFVSASFLPYLIALICIAAAFGLQWSVVSHISMPVDEDLYRDLGSAQGFLQGIDTRDAQFANATRWYSPLGAYVISLLSRLSGVGIFDLYTYGGPLLNSLGPIMLMILVSRMFSPWVGCYSVIAYVFLSSHTDPAWYTPTYSPWLWPFNFSQGIAFVALLAMYRAIVNPALGWLVLSGLLLGVTFLAHAAPAAVLALSLVILCAGLFLAGVWTWQRALQVLTVHGALSLMVAMLVLWPLFEAYHLKVLNPAPSTFIGMSLGETIRVWLHPKQLLGVPVLAWMLVGGPSQWRNSRGRSLFLAFSTASAIWLVYGLFADIARSKGWINLPQFVPTFHFNLYLLIAMNIAFGVGIVALLNRLRLAENLLPWCAGIIAFVVAGVAWPGYRENVDLHTFAKRADSFAQRQDVKPLYDWCLRNTSAEDVFLTDDFYGQYVIGAAARKVLVLDPIFTSPYLDLTQRAEDRRKLYDLLRQGEWASFNTLADRYRVRFVIVGPELRFGLYDGAPIPLVVRDTGPLKPVASFGEITVFERVSPAIMQPSN